MWITVVDPPAYTPPYDHSLCAALAARGLQVELATSRFRHESPPEPDGYVRSECFYRWAPGSRLAKAAQHPVDMLRLARRVRQRRPGVTHFQWLPLPALDVGLLAGFPRPRILSVHELPPPRRGAGRRRARLTKALSSSVEAVIVHSEHARGRLLDELSVRADKVAVIPHGSFDYLTRLREELPIDEAAGDLEGRKVVLCFGLIRPYKGIDLLLEAFASTPDEAVLLVVGRPLMPIEPLRRRARELGIEERVRLVPRFVAESEVPAYFRRADLVTLPYRDADQSGVVFTALAFGAPLLLSAVGGFVELAEQHGAARLVPPDDIDALAGAIVELLADDAARAALSKAARRAAEGPYSWSRAAHLTHELYLSLWDESR